eukprot:291490-Hanusia_phi.AAC.1
MPDIIVFQRSYQALHNNCFPLTVRQTDGPGESGGPSQWAAGSPIPVSRRAPDRLSHGPGTSSPARRRGHVVCPRGRARPGPSDGGPGPPFKRPSAAARPGRSE